MKWLFLVHQVHTPNSRERVRVWRLTRKVGAILYRNSVYVIPYAKERLEDFQWLCQQIRDSKGDASVFVSEARDPAEDATLRSLFVAARERDYLDLETSIRTFAEQYVTLDEQSPFTAAQFRRVERQLGQLEESCRETRRIDFFDDPRGTKVDNTLRELRASISRRVPRASGAPSPLKRHSISEYRGRTWATRPHIHIDRLCSAWLIKRFIDPKARFVFAPESKIPKGAIPFDVFGAEFSHQGERCTFETLLESFGLREKALSSIAEIVHEVDLKDQKYHRPESPGVDLIVRSLSSSLRDDARTLELGSRLLDALHERFSHAGKH